MTLQARRVRLLLIYAAASLPPVLFGAALATRATPNSPLDWVPGDFPARREYDEFTRVFGSGDVVVASWDGCTLDDGRLDELAKRLRDSAAFRLNGHSLLDRVTTGREAVAFLTQPMTGIERSEAVHRLRGTLVGPDGKTTCVVVSLTAAGLADRSRVVAELRKAIEETCLIPESRQHLAGPAIDGLAVDDASRQTLDRLAIPSAAVTFGVCWWCLRSLRAAGVVFGLAVYCQAVTLSLIHWSGGSMTALLIVLPPLVQVLAVAGGVHLINYYFDALRTGDPDDAPRRALQAGWLPCVLSAGTTAVGTASLLVSQLSPVRQFGGYASAGVLLTAGLLLTLIPAALAFKPLQPDRLSGKTRPPDENEDEDDPAADRHERDRAGWQRLTLFLSRYHLPVAAVILAVTAVAGRDALSARTSVRIETLFPANSRILSDYRWIESRLGPLVPIEVVLTCDADCTLSPRDRLWLVWRVHRELLGIKGVGGATSAVTFIPHLSSPDGLPADARRAVVEQALDGVRPAWIDLRQLEEQGKTQRWRATAFVPAGGNSDYGAFLRTVRERVAPVLIGSDGRPLPGVSLGVTGVMPLVHGIQRQLMSDLVASFATAFALIAVVMTILQAGVAAGLVAMIPNVFPTVIVFGLLARLGTALDIGTVMTASVALGIAVDDTLHFLTFFRRGVDAGQTRRAAVLGAYLHCGRAMVQTSVICGAGLAVFAFSDFLPTARFAYLMALLFAAALVGDLILLPALLLGPFGQLFESRATVRFRLGRRWFRRSKRPRTADANERQPAGV